MASSLRLLDHIKHSPLSQDLTERDCVLLEQVMFSHTLEKDEVLLREGETDDTLYLVVSGRLEVAKDAGGESVTLHIMGAGSLAGEMGFIDSAPHSASLIALEPAMVLGLKRDDFEKLVPEHPHVTYHIMRAIVRLGHTTLKRMNRQYVEMSNYITNTPARY